MARRRNRRKNRVFGNLHRDINRSEDIFDTALPFEPATRVDAGRSTETSNLLNQLRATSDPTLGSFAGRRSGQMSDYLKRLNDSTAGYDSQELTALREQRRRGLERGFQSGRAALSRGQANANVGSTQRGAQLLRLARDYGQQSTDAEQDLFVKSADEKQKRLETYGSELRGAEGDEFTRGRAAVADYQSALNAAQNSELERLKINLGQEAADRAARMGGILGVLGIVESRRNARKQNRLMRQSIDKTGSMQAAQQGGMAGYASAIGDLINQMFPEQAG